jgi:hypothetical protein
MSVQSRHALKTGSARAVRAAISLGRPKRKIEDSRFAMLFGKVADILREKTNPPSY